MGPGLGASVKKRKIRVCGIDKPWKQKDRVQIEGGLGETQHKVKAAAPSVHSATNAADRKSPN